MALQITIDIFSGRENPVIELTGKEAEEAIKHLKPGKKIKKGEMGLPPAPTLGYRGLVIEQTGKIEKDLPKVFRLAHGDMFGTNLAHRAADEDFEKFICESTGPIKKLDLSKETLKYILNEIDRFRDIRVKWPWDGKITWPLTDSCKCAPLYEPDWWNDGDKKQLHNNCYNYATNYRTDTFRAVNGGGQPGAAADARYTEMTCASVIPAAVKDNLIDKPSANNRCPGEGHLVALVMSPNRDFHWYRKGRNGYWSHKPGSTPVTNLDNSGITIEDPRFTDRGSYTDFCTFMVVMHGHVKIK